MTSPDLALVMPMAGRGSRFARAGRTEPKPLIDVAGRPAFWWATESVRQAAPLREHIYVVLEEHVTEFAIDVVIHSYYPDATIMTLSDVTRGAAESAAVGVSALGSTGPIAINDCDHAFRVVGLAELAHRLHGSAAGALLGFRATSPAYSYAVLDETGEVVKHTVEKQPVSPFALAGCYLFDEPRTFLEGLERYRAECEYPELYVSGVYNVLRRRGARVLFHQLAGHVAFGTPEELALVDPPRLMDLVLSS